MMYLYKTLKNITLLALFIIFVIGCGPIKKPDWGEVQNPDGKARARKNVEEGKGFSMGIGSGNNKGGSFQFASSNPMWRSTFEVLDFITLSNVDYAGGLIITDWYSEGNNNEAIKITIRFLSDEIRADGLDVTLHKKICNNNNNCNISKIDSDVTFEIKDSILRNAALIASRDSKSAKSKTPKKQWGADN
jgi:hypothetical protein